MPANFDLVITADYSNRTAELCLLGDDGSQVALRQTKFDDISVSR
jgi:hypothetical protein